MKVFVINLERSIERRELIRSQLNSIGLDFDIFKAIDGSQFSQSQLIQLCNQKWAKRHIGRPLIPGEIGCALSHLGVYRKIIDENHPMALVLEDDACLGADFSSVVSSLEQHLDRSDSKIALLSGAAGLSDNSVPLTGEYSLARVTSAAYLTHAYVVTHESAKRMLAALSPVVQVADDWGWISRHVGVDLYACNPAVAIQSMQESAESTISASAELRSEDYSARWIRLSWWKYKLYIKFWRALDHAGLGYFYWRRF